MNTPSPAPERRRRPRVQEPPEMRTPELADDFQRPAQAHRRRRPAQTPERAPDSTPNPKRERLSPLQTLPTPVRALLIALCCAVFFLSVLAVTRDYLARQEERRRLEAEAAERAQHPLYYRELIDAYSAAQEIDPALVAAVILCESSFDPMAESRVGARGLMQMMEDTGEWVAHRLGEDATYAFDDLYDPETSVRYGTWYLGYLSRRFGGDATKIVCAYHAGQGNVDSWLANPEYSADGVTLDVIPTADTAAYAGRVLRARDVYKKYYYAGDAPADTPAPVD